jgi:hypothetical protein
MRVVALTAEYLPAAFPTAVGPNRGSAIRAHTNGWLIANSTQADRIVIHLITSILGISPGRALTDCHDALLSLGLGCFRRDICFSSSADCAISVAAYSINLPAVTRSLSASRRSCSEVGLSCNTATMMPHSRMLKRGCGLVEDKKHEQAIKLKLLNLQSRGGPRNLPSSFVQLHPL